MATKRAICVGLNYSGTPFALLGCQNDAEAWTSLLRSKPFVYNQIVTLLDRYHPAHSNYPTIATFTKFLIDMLTQSKPGDTLLITYSGHGKQIVDQDGDEQTGFDNSLAFFNGTTIELMRDDQFHYLIMQHIKPGVKVRIMLDCCFSGSGIDLPFNYLRDIPNNIINRLKDERGNLTNWYQSMDPRDPRFQPIQSANIIMLSSSQDREKSLDLWNNGNPMGAMTKTLTTLIGEKKSRVGVELTWLELVDTITFQMGLANDIQQPQLSCSNLTLVLQNDGTAKRIDI